MQEKVLEADAHGNLILIYRFPRMEQFVFQNMELKQCRKHVKLHAMIQVKYAQCKSVIMEKTMHCYTVLVQTSWELADCLSNHCTDKTHSECLLSFNTAQYKALHKSQTSRER